MENYSDNKGGMGRGRTLTCKHCGESSLRWDRAYIESTRTRNNPSGYMRMWNPRTGEIHKCDEWYRKLRNYPGGLEPAAGQPKLENPEEITEPKSPLEAMKNGINASGITRAEASRMIDTAVGGLRSEAIDADNQLRLAMTTANNVLLGHLSELENKVNQARPIEVVMPDGTKRAIERQHKEFENLLNLAQLRLNVFLVGPAGGGKTSAAEKAAEALGLAFYLQPMGPGVTESRLLGWMDANGQVVRTLFREAYEHGGVFMADEMDNANASALTTLNGALANGVVGFPDGMISRHKDFIFIGGANTYGRGADRMYVGRQQLDGATLDRMATLDWDYDEEFELYLAGNDQKEWVLYVQKIRKIAFQNKLRVIVSPRASIDGAKMLRAGLKRELVEAVRLWAAMPENEKTTIKNNLGKDKATFSYKEPTTYDYNRTRTYR